MRWRCAPGQGVGGSVQKVQARRTATSKFQYQPCVRMFSIRADVSGSASLLDAIGCGDRGRKRIDALFDIEREINGFSVEKRLAARQERSAALVAALEAWMRAERAKLSRHAAVAKAMDYMLTRWEAFTRFLDYGRICLTNNAAERALRGLALGQEVMAVCRIGARSRARRSHVHAHPDRQAQRYRSTSVARYRSRLYGRHAADEARRPAPMELGRPTPPPKTRVAAAYAGGLRPLPSPLRLTSRRWAACLSLATYVSLSTPA